MTRHRFPRFHPGLLVAIPLLVSAALVEAADLKAVAERHFDSGFLDRATAYRNLRYVLFVLQVALTAAVVWAVALRARPSWRDRALALGRGHDWAARIVLLVGLLGSLVAIRLPFSIVRFLHARDAGLRHDGIVAFLADWAKAQAVGWVLAAVVATVILGLFARWGRAWWLAAGGLVGVLAAAYASLAPLVVDPLFNRIEPMPPSPLAEEVLRLAREGGVPARDVWVADASRRTRAVNAYFTGVGPTRRIVLYDTLVEKLPPEEVRLVVAHEIGHWRHHHLFTGLALGVSALVLGLGLVHAVSRRALARLRWIRSAGRRGDPLLVLPAYALYFSIMILVLPVTNTVSRAMETQADRAAITLTGDPDTFIRAKVRIAGENLSHVAPPRWIEIALFTHPAAARRIAMGEAMR